jgi:hypothetical protein
MTGDSRAGTSDRLSLRTLLIASIASATAAVITSRFWAPGTAFAAAVTPVIVSLVSELLYRPAEHVSRLRGSRRTASPASIQAPAYEPPQVRNGVSEKPSARPTRGSGRRRLRPKIALLTGAIAFAIAAAALTLPELIFGGAAVTNRHTTIFGGKPPAQSTPTAPETTETAPPGKPRSETTGTTTPTSPPPNRQPPARETTPPAQTTPAP